MEPYKKGDYYRECPYCGTAFMSKHMNRKYCYKPNDYCKRRYESRIKRIMKELNEITDKPTCKNIAILHFLKIKDELIISVSVLINMGIDFDAIYRNKKDSEDKSQVIYYGFSFSKQTNNKLLIKKVLS